MKSRIELWIDSDYVNNMRIYRIYTDSKDTEAITDYMINKYIPYPDNYISHSEFKNPEFYEKLCRKEIKGTYKLSAANLKGEKGYLFSIITFKK